MLQFMVSGVPQASALWRIRAQQDLEAECLGTTNWGLIPPPHLKRSAQLNYGHKIYSMSEITLTPWVLSCCFFFFFLSPNTYKPETLLVQSLWSYTRKRNNSKDWKLPLWTKTTTASVPEEPKIAELQHDNRQPAPKQWLYSPKSLSLFDTAGGASLNSATELDDWSTHSVLVLQFNTYHWILMSIRTPASNTTFLPLLFFFLKRKSTCPKFQERYKK